MRPSARMLALLGGVTLVVLVLGWRLKASCFDQAWDGFQYTNFCYSDLQVQYSNRLAGGQGVPFPYTGVEGEPGFNEYPVLTGLFMYVAAVVTDGFLGYMVFQAVVLGAIAVGTTAALASMAPPRMVMLWAAAPALFLYAFYSWDLLAVGACTAAILAYRRERFLWAGVLLALGASAKLYPAFLMPALGLALVARENGLGKRGWALGLGFVGTWLAVNAPFMLLDFAGWMETYTWQMARGPNLESPYFVLGHLARYNGLAVVEPFSFHPAASTLSLLMLVLSLAASGWLALNRRVDPLVAAALPVFAFLAFNKVQSIQYVLWAIPFLALLPMRPGQRAAVVLADLAVFLALFRFFAAERVDGTLAFLPVAVAVLLRCATYVWILETLVQRCLPKPAPAPKAAAPAATPAQPAARQP